jgi:hypothetical protein
MAVVAVAVMCLAPQFSEFLEPAFGALSGVAGAFVAGTLSSVASQGVGMALGVVDHFSLRSAIGNGIASAITFGISNWGKAGAEAAEAGAAAAKASLASKLLHGTLKAVGNASAGYIGNKIAGVEGTSFSWRSIAASVVTAGIMKGVDQVGDYFESSFMTGKGGFLSSVTHNFVSGVVTTHVRRKLGFDDDINYGAMLADAFGNALGNRLGGQVAESIESHRTRSSIERLAKTASNATVGEAGTVEEGSFLSDGNDVAPTLKRLTQLYGEKVANEMYRSFTEGTGTVNADGKLALDPKLLEYLQSLKFSDADIAAERARLVSAAEDQTLRVNYDFGYVEQKMKGDEDLNGSRRWDESMTPIGDEIRAITLVMNKRKVPLEFQSVIQERVFGKNNDLEIPREYREQFKLAEGDLHAFISNRDKFFDGLATASIGVRALEGFVASRPVSQSFATNVGNMRAAMQSGYFTLRPEISISRGLDVYHMQQYNEGANSEIIVYKEAFSRKFSKGLFARGIFHELTHTHANQQELYALTGDKRKLRSTTYKSDPKSYYDESYKRGIIVLTAEEAAKIEAARKAAEAAKQAGKPPVTEKPNLPNGGSATAKNYADGNLHEGWVNNWYPKVIFDALKIWP